MKASHSVKSRPILLEEKEIHPILDGTLTELLRKIEAPISTHTNSISWNYMSRKYIPWEWESDQALNVRGRKTGEGFSCPYGDPEDKLWGKEWTYLKGSEFLYAADLPSEKKALLKKEGWKIQRSSHMKLDHARVNITLDKIDPVQIDGTWFWRLFVSKIQVP